MNLTKTQPKQSEIELRIEVSAAEYQPFLEKAARKLSETNAIPGFRVGHAPYDLVKQRLGEMKIFESALDDILSHFYFEAIKQENLNSVGQPKIEIEKFAPGNDLVFKAVVALMPKVTVADYSKIKVKRKETVIEESELGKTINDLRKMQVKEALVDRPAKVGDLVEVDFTLSLDKVVIDGGSGKKYPLVIGDKIMVPGFEEQLIGLKAGEEKEFQLTFPEGYQNTMVAGKLCDFKVKLLAVYQRDLPEANDDWAKTLGAEDLSDLQNKIKDNLLQEKKFTEEQKAEIELLTKIIEKSDFSEIPDLLIANEAHRMVHEFADSIENQGITFEEYLKSLNKDEKALEAEFKPKALERVKSSLVIREIAEKEAVSASPEELKEETDKILSQLDSEEAKNNVLSPGYQAYLETIVRNQKVLAKLKSQCIE